MDDNKKPTSWHRLLGLALADYFEGTCFEVEMEQDLSRKRQILDVVILERRPDLPPPDKPLVTGFEHLSKHNLLTFKSGKDTLNLFSLLELLGHYVNYCKNLRHGRMIDKEADRLFAVSMRFPKRLAETVPLKQQKPGLYLISALGLPIHLIVTREIPRTEHDALWNLFGMRPETIQYGYNHYHWKSGNRLPITKDLMERYRMEDQDMYNFELYHQDTLGSYSQEERVEGVDPHVRVKGVDPYVRVEGVDPHVRVKGVDPHIRVEGVDPHVRVEGVDYQIRTAGLGLKELLEKWDIAEVEAYIAQAKKKDP